MRQEKRKTICLARNQENIPVVDMPILGLVSMSYVYRVYSSFNNIAAISWRSVLLVEETEYPEKTTELAQVTTLHYVVSSTPRHERDSNSKF
jgi:hypothetical protein